MKEFIEKLNARLEEELKTAREMQTTQCIGHDGYGTPLQSKLGGEICALLKAKNIANQLAEEYNNESVKGDLISRSALVEKLRKKMSTKDVYWTAIANVIIGIVEEQPTVKGSD